MTKKRSLSPSVKHNHDNLTFTGERLIPELNEGTAFYYEHLARYFFCCQFVKNKIVLDAGSGAGYGAHILASYGKAKHVIGVDLSEQAVKYSAKNYGRKNNTFAVDNVEKLITIKDKSIDVLVNFEVIEHLDHPETFLKQVKRVVSPKGLVIISTPNKLTYPSGNKFHMKEYGPTEFMSLLKNYFSSVKMIPQNFRLTQEICDKSHMTFSLGGNTRNKYQVQKKDSLESMNNLNNSEYVVAVCSDISLPNIVSLSMPQDKVDHFDLTKGLISLSKQFSDMHLHGKSLELSIENLTIKLNQYEKERSYHTHESKKIYILQTELTHIKNEINFFYSTYGEFLAKYSELYPNVYFTQIPTLAELAIFNKKGDSSYEPIFYRDFYNKVSTSRTYQLWQFICNIKKELKKIFKK